MLEDQSKSPKTQMIA